MIRWTVALCVAAIVLSGIAVAQEQELTQYQKGLEAYRAGTKLVRDKQPDEALVALQEMVKGFPGHDHADNALMQVAGLQRTAKDYEAALATYEKVLSDYADSEQAPPALVGKAWVLYYGLKDYKAAADVNQKVGTEFPGYSATEGALWTVIDCRSKLNDHEGVIEAADAYLAAGVSQGGRIPQVLPKKALAQTALGDEAGAQATLEQIANASDGSYMAAYTHRLIAQQYDRSKNPEKAAEHYHKASQSMASGSAGADLYYATLRMTSAKEYEEAIALCREYLRRFPKGNYANIMWFNIANIYSRHLKDREKEEATFKEFLEAQPDAYNLDLALHKMASAQVALKDTETAEETYRELVEKMPASQYADDALWQLMNLLRREKDTLGATQVLEKLAEEYPETTYGDAAARRLERM